MKWIGKHIFGFDATFRQNVTIDGNLTVAGTSTSFGDDDKIILGGGGDGEIYVSYDDLYIVNTTDDKDIIFKGSDDGVDTTALTLDMSAGGSASFSHDLNLVDSGKIQLGNSNDFFLRHDGSDSEIHNQTGDLTIKTSTSDKDIIFSINDGGSQTELMRMDGSTGRVGIGVSSPLALLDVNGNIYSNGNVVVDDI